MAQEAGQISEEEEFEFRRRMEMESATQVKKGAPSGFLDQHPNLRTALQIGLPTAGAVAGGLTMAPLTGGMSMAPAAALVLAGEGMGGLLGESINQATGVSEESAMQKGLAMAAPGVGKAVGGIIGNFPRLLPGYGEALRAAFTQDIKALPEKLLGGGPGAQALYNQLAQKSTGQRLTRFPELQKSINGLTDDLDDIPFEKLKQDLKGEGLEDLFEQISGALKGTGPKMAMAPPIVSGKATNTLATGLPNQTVQVAPAKPAGLTFEEVKAATEGFGRIISKTSDPVVRGNYQQLYKAILKDVENMPPIAGVPTKEWQAAREATKRKYAEVSLTEATERAIRTKDGVDIVDPNQVIKWLRTNDDVRSRVSGTEYRKILNEYRYLSSAVGHNMGHLLTGLAGATAGGVGGATASVVGFEMLSRGMMTEPGRRAIHAWASNQTQDNLRRATMILAAGTRAATSGPGGEE